MLLVPCENMNCGALLTSSCGVVSLYIKTLNHSSTLSCLLDSINCGIDKSRITYYNNAEASFNFLELHTQPSGDIHPQPGPDSQLSIPVRITQRPPQQKNSHLSCNHSTSTRIISETVPTFCSSLMTINTSSSKRNMENLCLVSRVPYTSRSSTEAHMPNCGNPNNLITIQRLPLKAGNARHMSICLLNSRSINNKVLIIQDYVVDHQIDILGITETWTKSDGESNRVVNELSPRGYSFIHVPRKKRSGGGINLLYNTRLKNERVDCDSYASFEYSEVKLHTASTVVRIVVVYCPPSSKVNKLTSAQFFHDFNDLLEHFSVSSGRLLIMGDFNFHVNEPSRDRLVAKFLDFLDS